MSRLADPGEEADDQLSDNDGVEGMGLEESTLNTISEQGEGVSEESETQGLASSSDQDIGDGEADILDTNVQIGGDGIEGLSLPSDFEQTLESLARFERDTCKLLKSKELLVLQTLDTVISLPYHELWTGESNALFRRAVVMRARRKRLRQKKGA